VTIVRTAEAKRLPKGAALLCAALVLGACSTLSSLDSAARNLDTYELRAVAPETPERSGTGPTLIVAEPGASGAVASDRVVVKPDPLRVAFLPDARWVDPAPVHLQQLLARSISDTGRFGLVTVDPTVPLPDYTLVTDIEAFQAAIAPVAGQPVRVEVALRAAVIRETDGRVVSRRSFAARAAAGSDDARAVLPAFDAATSSVLRQVVSWMAGIAREGV
jgi:cholesterol transport system auxiliary component